MIAKKTSVKKAPVKAVGFFVYIGPSIRGMAERGAVIQGNRDTVEAAMKGAIAEYPEIRDLLIPGEELHVKRPELNMSGSLIHNAYKKLTARLKAGK